MSGIEQFDDPGTIRHLEDLGAREGWRCLEVGAVGGSIAAWLCERVGPTGRVMATDLDTRFLESLEYRNLDVRRHDVTRDDLPVATFDLVHERALLLHLPSRAQVLPCRRRGSMLDVATLLTGWPTALMSDTTGGF